jgi:hypothetical protein
MYSRYGSGRMEYGHHRYTRRWTSELNDPSSAASLKPKGDPGAGELAVGDALGEVNNVPSEVSRCNDGGLDDF